MSGAGGQAQDESAAEPHRHPRPRRTNPVDRIPWVVYLPQQIHDAADAARGAMPWSEWVLDAYRHVHTQLDTLGLAQDDSGLPPRATSLRRNITRPREKQLKLSAAEINIIESKMETIGESNRSAFITAVVELRLTQLNR